MTENPKMLRVAAEEVAAMLDPKSITQIVIAALRNAVGLALGTAMDDGRFDERAAMLLAEGIQVAVGEQSFWVKVFQHDEVAAAAKRLGDLTREAALVEHVREHRDARWRAAVNGLVMTEPEMHAAIGALARANDAELSAEGRQAKIWALELETLLKGE